MELASPDQMREVDRMTIEDVGIPGIVLMERAALGAVDHLLESAPEVGRIIAICGGGNNGGDGYAMARLLTDRGIDVEIVALDLPDPESDAGLNHAICEKLEVAIHDFSDVGEAEMTDALGELEPPDVWCDAIFGTGLDRPVEGRYARAIEFLAGARVFGVDIPSGIDASNGEILGVAARCFATATFALPKLGQAVEPGASACGELRVVDIGVPQFVYETVGTTATQLTLDLFDLPPRADDAHKGDAGRVVVVGGAVGTTGASIMSARAALASGAGLVTIAAPAEAATSIHAALPQAMAADWSEGLEDLLEAADVVVCGPGMGKTAQAVDVLEKCIRLAKILVLDADALNLVAEGEVTLDRENPTFLTPHPGEAARLLSASIAELLEDPYDAVTKLCEEFSSHAVFKTSRSTVASPDGRLAVNSSGNPGMATGGMGDALTGILAARLCEEDDGYEALTQAVFAHGMAADLAAETVGHRALGVDHLIEQLGAVWRLWEKQ